MGRVKQPGQMVLVERPGRPQRPMTWTWLARMAAPGVLFAALLGPASADTNEVTLPRFPSISPDGTEIVFTWGGDLWRAGADGGTAIRLTRHHLDDLHSSWSPDGQWIVFTSMRDGYMNLWRIHRDGTRLTQVTHGDRFLRNPAYGLDENGEPVITFSGLLEADVHREERSYKVSPEGGEYTRLNNAFGSWPELSPDGSHLAFTRGGSYHGWNRRHYRGPDAMNVWVQDRASGGFQAITSFNGDDGSAQWANDRTLVFMSDRQHQTVNLFRVDLTDAERTPTALTEFAGRDLQHFDVSRDGRTAVLHVWDTLYTLDLTDSDARPRAIRLHAGDDGHDRYELKQIDRQVSEAALSPDGKTMASIAYGRVYVRHMDEHSQTRAVTPGSHARHQNLAWSPDGSQLFFTGDADGTSSIYRARVALTRDDLRRNQAAPSHRASAAASMSGTSAPMPSVPILSASLKTVTEAAEAAGSDQPMEPEPAQQGGDPEDPFAPTDPDIPPDPSAPTDPADPSDPSDPPASPTPPRDQPDTPDSIPEDELDLDSPGELPAYLDPARWHDAVRFSVHPLVQTAHNDRDVSPSPDGRAIAFRRGRGDLMIMDLESGDTRTLVQGWDDQIRWRWSPDSRHIAYAQNDLNYSANIFIVPADGSRDPVNITRHPRNDLNPRWSADGRKLTFISNRAGDSYDLYRVYLDPELETYTAREFSTYYRDARKAAAERRPLPVAQQGKASGRSSSRGPNRGQDVPSAQTRGEQAGAGGHGPDLDTAWRRIRRITNSPAHETANEMSPGGDKYVFNAGTQGLMVMNWDGSNRKQLGPAANVQHLSITGDKVVYVSRGRVGVVPLTGGDHRHPDISDRIRIDLGEQSLQKFREATRMIGENFYRPDMKGLDWPQVVRDYETLIRRARTASEFSDIANRTMGELSASHMGITNPGPSSDLRQPSGRLGIDHEPMTLPDGRIGLRITDVVAGGPADRGPNRVQVGDILTEIDLQALDANDTLMGLLRGRADDEVIVSFERPVGNRLELHRLLLTPVDYSELARLKYDAHGEQRRQLVHELSDGRLGYLHIQAMNQSSLEGFQGDLYAAAEGKEGLIIDVRNNGGGNTTDRILTSIMAPDHAYTVPAGADPSVTGHYPQDRLDAPRYTLPINMLANEKSFSNAEILAHAFSSLDRGTLVGQQTYGGVISTGIHRLIDGATVRRPFRGWYKQDGTDMEHNGAMPDIVVQQTPEDEVAGRDRQMESAVTDLLDRLDAQKQPRDADSPTR